MKHHEGCIGPAHLEKGRLVVGPNAHSFRIWLEAPRDLLLCGLLPVVGRYDDPCWCMTSQIQAGILCHAEPWEKYGEMKVNR